MRVRIFALVFSVSILSLAQDHRVTVSFENEKLETILDTLSRKTGFFFSYNSDIFPKGSKYTISSQNESIDQFLSKLLIGTRLQYSFYKDQIIINYERQEQTGTVKKNSFNVSGKVIDENGEPLNNANVFLDGTTIGTYTDIDGNYKLESIPPGLYDLVFSHVGYQNMTIPISEYNGGARMMKCQMEIDLGQLEEVEVISNRVARNQSSWLEFYTIFREDLLGSSSNSGDCTIKNPGSLDFSYNQGTRTLKAFSSEPLIIDNNALGYRINFFLESYSKADDDLRYRGKMQFENLTPLSKSDKQKWIRQRKGGYKGSFNHFKKALLRDELKKEGFKIYFSRQLNQLNNKKSSRVSSKDILSFKGDHYVIDFDGYLLVEYTRENESVDFLNNTDEARFLYSSLINSNGVLTKQPSNQLSVVRLLKSKVRLDLSGQILDKFALTTYGYWSWERLADSVPINYDPKSDNL